MKATGASPPLFISRAGLLAFLAIFVMLIAVPPAPVLAFTNGITHSNHSTAVCTSASTCTQPALTITASGDLITGFITCGHVTATLVALTDASGDVFNLVTSVIVASGTNDMTMTGFYALATSTTTGTFTITLQTTANNCVWYVADVNTLSTGLVGSSVVSQAEGGAYSYTMTSNPNTYFQSGANYVIMNAVTSAAQVSNGPSQTVNSPLVLENAQYGGTSGCGAGGCFASVGDQYVSAGTLGPFQTISINSYCTTSCPSLVGLIAIALYFNQSGVGPVCTGANVIVSNIGGAASSASTIAVPSNTTFYYAQVTGAIPVTVTDLKMNVSSISLSNSQTSAKLEIAIYEGGSVLPTNTQPLTRTPTGFWQYSIVNRGAEVIDIPVSFQIGANTVYTVAWGVSHDGLTLYQTSTSVTMYQNTQTFVGGYPPVSLTAGAVSATSLMRVYGTIVTPCVLSQVTTVTSVSTVVQTLAGTTSGINVGNMATLLESIVVIMGPALILATATKNLWGGILGAVLGIGVGVYIGFAPFWLVPLVIITVIGMLFFARPQGGGGGV